MNDVYDFSSDTSIHTSIIIHVVLKRWSILFWNWVHVTYASYVLLWNTEVGSLTKYSEQTLELGS